MPVTEVEMNLFAGESVKIMGPAHLEVKGGISATTLGKGLFENGQQLGVANGTKATALVGGGKISAIKSSGLFSGTLMKGLGAGGAGTGLASAAPALISIVAMTAVGYALYRVNDKLMKKLTSYQN